MADSGLYCLIVRIDRDLIVRVGRLGPIRFARGTYLYTGSARCRLGARIARHLRERKVHHWHIDYLLAHPEVRIGGVIVEPDLKMSECKLNRVMLGLADGAIPRFGSSDCQSGCGSHLVYISHK